MLEPLQVRKREKDPRQWDPIHFTEDIPEEYHGILNEITRYMKREPDAYVMQIKWHPLVIHAEGSTNLQWFIYELLKK